MSRRLDESNIRRIGLNIVLAAHKLEEEVEREAGIERRGVIDLIDFLFRELKTERFDVALESNGQPTSQSSPGR